MKESIYSMNNLETSYEVQGDHLQDFKFNLEPTS